MKTPVLILLILISISCSHSRSKDQRLSEDPAPGYNYDWLIGSWIRCNDEEENSTYEHWMKNSSTEYTGLGCILQDGDTIIKENLRLIKTGEEWNLDPC